MTIMSDLNSQVGNRNLIERNEVSVIIKLKRKKITKRKNWKLREEKWKKTYRKILEG